MSQDTEHWAGWHVRSVDGRVQGEITGFDAEAMTMTITRASRWRRIWAYLQRLRVRWPVYLQRRPSGQVGAPACGGYDNIYVGLGQTVGNVTDRAL